MDILFKKTDLRDKTQVGLSFNVYVNEKTAVNFRLQRSYLRMAGLEPARPSST